MKNANILWLGPDENVAYEAALVKQEHIVDAIAAHNHCETIWMLSHTCVYTAGTSAKDADLLNNFGAPVYKAGRGGQYTWHGPGQRVVYPMLDLSQRGKDLRRYIFQLEQWIIDTLADFDIKGERKKGRIGIWVKDNAGAESKIAAIGVRVRRWISFHGLAINVNPDLHWYKGIVPCGITNFGVTSMEKLGVDVSMRELDQQLKHHFNHIFI